MLKSELIELFIKSIRIVVNSYWGGLLFIIIGVLSFWYVTINWKEHYNTFSIRFWLAAIISIIIGFYIIITKLFA